MSTLTVTRLEQRTMGVACAVTVVGTRGFDHARHGLERADRLEQLWSRFLPTSDISRLNNSGGRVTFVDPQTVHLIEVMKAAHAVTRGSFNPTHLDAQVAHGDQASRHGTLRTVIPGGAHSHHMDSVEIVDDFAVRMHDGVLLDAGGIGKGLAADVIAAGALARGADGVCVNLGGDMRCMGASPDGNGWEVTVMSPLDASVATDHLLIREGAVATSAVSARRRADGTVPSHIIDPSRGAPHAGTVVGASVIASSAAWAEAFAKHAIISPGAVDDISAHGLACVTVDDHGVVTRNSNWQEFCA